MPIAKEGREIASEQREEAGDRNADAGGYFLNGRSPLRMRAPRGACLGRRESLQHRSDRN